MNTGKLLILRYNKKLMALLTANNRLLAAHVYEEESFSLVGGIYIGKVQSIVDNIDAAFVEIEKNKRCFLPLSDIKEPHLINRAYNGRLHVGDELVVQVTRDAIKTKQPFLTTRISLAGTYLVAADGPTQLGMSAKLSGAAKEKISQFLQKEGLIDAAGNCLSMENMGMVVRTNAGTLKEDMEPLLREWESLKEQLTNLLAAAVHRTCFSCLKKNEKGYLSDLKDYYAGDFNEIVTDCEDIYKELKEYYQDKGTSEALDITLRLYQDEYPLEKLYSVKTLLNNALESRVWLKSGAYLIIEPTEALTVIDVNTGKCEAGRHSEDTFFQINMEAAEEIALQIRLRNLSGIIIVDFINMVSEERQKALLNRLDVLTKGDSVKTAVVDITPLGLVEITRKRISRPLRELL